MRVVPRERASAPMRLLLWRMAVEKRARWSRRRKREKSREGGDMTGGCVRNIGFYLLVAAVLVWFGRLLSSLLALIK